MLIINDHYSPSSVINSVDLYKKVIAILGHRKPRILSRKQKKRIKFFLKSKRRHLHLFEKTPRGRRFHRVRGFKARKRAKERMIAIVEEQRRI